MPVLELFQQIVVFFIMMAMGYLLVKCKILKTEDSKILSLISIYIILPCVNINAFQIEFRSDVLQGFLIALMASILLHILLLCLTKILGKVFSLTSIEKMSIMYPNAGNLVIPIVLSLFGQEWVIYASAFMAVQIFFLWTHAQTVISEVKKIDLRKIVTNINLITVLLGFLLFICRVQLPMVVKSTLTYITGTFAPVSMIMIGMMIAASPLQEIIKEKRTYIVIFLRLVVTPVIAMWVLLLLKRLIQFPDIDIIFTIVLLPLIAPAAATIVQLSQLYNNQPEYSSRINVMSTLFCIITMPMVMAIWNYFL